MKSVNLFLSGCLVWLCSGQIQADPSPVPSALSQKVLDFDLYQHNYFDALVHLPVSQMKSESPQALIRRAEALNGFGLEQQAGMIYQRLVKENSSESALAYFNLGLQAYNKHKWKEALALFNKVDGRVSNNIKVQLQFYKSSVYLKLQQPEEAANILGKMKSGLWAAYGYYDLGVSYAHSDSDPSRATIALRVADALDTGDDEQSLDVKDQILFSAGYLALQSNDPDKALSFLNKIRQIVMLPLRHCIQKDWLMQISMIIERQYKPGIG
jgi:tetratricopeptide (TPR) repeat protein